MLKSTRSFAIILAAFVYSASEARTERMPNDAIGCKKMDILQQIGRVLKNSDYESYKRLTTDMIESGECKLFSRGEDVLVDAKNGRSVCLKSGNTCYWAPVEFK